jgi:hypothetical protein
MQYFSYYLLCFFFNKIGEQEGGTGPASMSGRGGQILCTNVSTCKNDKIKKKEKRNIKMFCWSFSLENQSDSYYYYYYFPYKILIWDKMLIQNFYFTLHFGPKLGIVIIWEFKGPLVL